MPFKTHFGVIVLAVVASIIAPAVQALDIGQCANLEEITNALKAEGQHSFASATRLTQESEGLTKERTLLGILMTANDPGTLGYILQTDKPLGDGATQACVTSRLSHVRLFDARKAAAPQPIDRKSDEKAMRRCAVLIRAGEVTAENCGSLEKRLQQGAAIGQTLMLQASNMRRQNDGAYLSDNILVTIVAKLRRSGDRLSDGVGTVFNTTPDGATVLRLTLIDVRYTSSGEKMLAALRP